MGCCCFGIFFQSKRKNAERTVKYEKLNEVFDPKFEKSEYPGFRF